MKQYSFLEEFVVATGLALTGATLSSILLARKMYISRQITKYVKRMTIELQKVNPNDRQSAKQIIESYCYNIGSYGDKQFNAIPKKQKQKIQRRNFNGRQYCISQLYIPLMKIINNPQNGNWKDIVLEYLNNARIQRFTQNLISNMFTIAGIGLSAGYAADTWNTPWNSTSTVQQPQQV